MRAPVNELNTPLPLPPPFIKFLSFSLVCPLFQCSCFITTNYSYKIHRFSLFLLSHIFFFAGLTRLLFPRLPAPMPQVETLVSACAGGRSGDRKIACETLADGESHQTEETDRPKNNPDSPPESFWLSRDEELDWWDRNAVYERKDSAKGNSSNSANLNPSLKSKSQRVCFKSKASIIGLPKPQKPSFGDAKNRRNHKPGNTRLFPKRSASVGKSESSLNEPSSPKVSCMGKVRSRRDRNRRLRSRQRSSDSGPAKEKLMRSKSRNRKPGFFERFRAIFRSRRRENKVQKADLPPEDSSPRKSRTTQARNSTASDIDASFAESTPRNSVTESEPPGLGGMKRFVSGRRSGAWGVGDPEVHVQQ